MPRKGPYTIGRESSPASSMPVPASDYKNFNVEGGREDGRAGGREGKREKEAKSKVKICEKQILFCAPVSALASRRAVVMVASPAIHDNARASPREGTALVTVECRNLKWSNGGEKIDSKCVVSVGEYEYCLGKRKNNFKWEVVGETEIARGNLSPQFENTIEIQYDMSKSRLLRFDLFGSSSVTMLANEDEDHHIGVYVCDVNDLLKSPNYMLDGSLVVTRRTSTEKNLHLQFEATKSIRATLNISHLQTAFKGSDFDNSCFLGKTEFKHALQLMARQGGFHMDRKTEDLLWSLSEEDGNGAINYKEFIGLVYGTQGYISVMVEDQNIRSVDKHAGLLFSKYQRDLNKVLGRQNKVGVSEDDFDDQKYVKKMLQETQNRAMRFVRAQRIPTEYRGREEQHTLREQTGVLQMSDKNLLVDSRPARDPMEWDRRSKGLGIILTKGNGIAVATCNLLHENAGPCSVRSTQPIPNTGITYFELSIRRDSPVQPGEGLGGSYAVGLATSALEIFDGAWTHPVINPACYALVSSMPTKYEARWSLRNKSPYILVHGPNNDLATLNEESVIERIARGDLKRTDIISNIRAHRPLPSGTCYFEITIKMAGKRNGESLGGDCHVGLCSEKMLGWTGDWTKSDDNRREEAWTLCDNWNGQLSMPVFGNTADKLSETQMMQMMQKKFQLFDQDNSGTLDWEELHLALKEMSISCTDDEVRDMFLALGLKQDEEIHFEEYVSIIRSKAANGIIFHVEKKHWNLNSFFGVGDTIGFQVDTIKGVAQIFKNKKWLGQGFTDLPSVIYPFVSLPNVGKSAVITSDTSKCIDSKSERFIAGYRKLWVDGSGFGAADRIGFLVNMDAKACDIYKNGAYLGRAFERLPPNLHPFATLCHTGSKASLCLPPQPNPWYYEYMRSNLEKSKYCVIRDIPCAGGRIDLSETGTSCGIQLNVLEGGEHQRGDRRFLLRACDIESLMDNVILGGIRPARIVSPLVQVTHLGGPAFDTLQTKLTIPHCCSRLKNLKLVFMPCHMAVSTEHRNVWAELDTTWSSKLATCSIKAGGIFCVLCLDDPVENPDLVHIEYRLFDPEWEGEIGQSSQILALEHLPGSREPKFCCVKLGTSLHGVITIRPISAVQVSNHKAHEALDTPLPRGSLFQSLTAVGQDENGLHHNVRFSDTECFTTSGCALWMQSTFMTNSHVRVPWKGFMLDLPFKVKTVAVKEKACFLQKVMSRKMDWNPLLAENSWMEYRYLFEPSSGTLFQGPKDSFLSPSEIAGWQDADVNNCSNQEKRRSEILSFIKIAQLPGAQFQASTEPESMLSHVLTLHVTSGQIAGGKQTGAGDKVGNSAEEKEAIVLASGSKEDRDEVLQGLRYFMALHEPYRSMQQIFVTVTLSADFPLGETKEHITSDGPIKNIKKYYAEPQTSTKHELGDPSGKRNRLKAVRATLQFLDASKVGRTAAS